MLAKRDGLGRAYTTKEVDEAFWHELTHAILYAMGGKKLAANEEFVHDFAKRLNNAVHSAEFE